MGAVKGDGAVVRGGQEDPLGNDNEVQPYKSGGLHQQTLTVSVLEAGRLTPRCGQGCFLQGPGAHLLLPPRDL